MDTPDTPDQSLPVDQLPNPVALFVSQDEVTVSDDLPASFWVAMEIEEPICIVAALAGESELAKRLIPLRVGLVEGRGVAVYADYPAGEPLETQDAQGESVLVYRGRIEFEVAIEKSEGTGVTPGHPVLGVSFQPWEVGEDGQGGGQARPPMTLELGVQITIE